MTEAYCGYCSLSATLLQELEEPEYELPAHSSIQIRLDIHCTSGRVSPSYWGRQMLHQVLVPQ
jgi:hypothetical protein